MKLAITAKDSPCCFKVKISYVILNLGVCILRLNYALSKQRPLSLLFIDFSLQVLWNYISAPKKKTYAEVNAQPACLFSNFFLLFSGFTWFCFIYLFICLLSKVKMDYFNISLGLDLVRKSLQNVLLCLDCFTQHRVKSKPFNILPGIKKCYQTVLPVT